MCLVHSELSLQLFKVGKRYEEYITIPEYISKDPKEQKTYTPLDGLYMKIYTDSRLMSKDITTIPEPKVPNNIKIQPKKCIVEGTAGLHRLLEYSLSIEIDEAIFDSSALATGNGYIAILDYADYGFYIDREEIEQTETFEYIENDVMNIEQMDGEVPQYIYALKFKLTEDDVQMNGDKVVIKIDKTLKYHLRYGSPNTTGTVARKFDDSFEIITNLIKTDKLDFIKHGLQRLTFAIEKLNVDPRGSFFTLSGKEDNGYIQLPVGNTNSNQVVTLSTILCIISSLALLVYQIQNKEINE